MDVRLIQDAPASGPRNMAVDEVLAESLVGAGQGGNLRFYGWAPATLSLGYFQPRDQRHAHEASRDCPLVRRASGGGAILHDHELTYSLTLAVSRHVDADLQAYYRALHATLIATLEDFGVAARLCEEPIRHPKAAEPFLCFQRRSEGDVLIGDHKIAGSAQRRYRKVLLQHGSVLLRRSEYAPELPGIEELAGVTLAPDQLARRWQQRVASELGLNLAHGRLSDRESLRVSTWTEDRYANHAWTARR